ncbi:hypothetical protein HK405_013176 [Cladochytrium tenue]|nr:hypothetical protein HK405_013176 [Cladochytrium tenue]
MIALQVALTAPRGQLSHLALVSTAGTRPRPSWTLLGVLAAAAVGWTPLKTERDLHLFFCRMNFTDPWLDARTEEPYTDFPTNRDAMRAMLAERSKDKTRQTSKGRSLQTKAASTHNPSPPELASLGNGDLRVKVFVGDNDYVRILIA